MTIGLFSRCLGFTASLWAIPKFPQFSKDGNVRCLVGLQPTSAITAMERNFERDGVPMEKMEDVDRICRLQTSFGIHELGSRELAKSVFVPTCVYQVRDDFWTKPGRCADDLQ